MVFLVVGRCIPQVFTSEEIRDQAGDMLMSAEGAPITGNQLKKALGYLARFYKTKEVIDVSEIDGF